MKFRSTAVRRSTKHALSRFKSAVSAFVACPPPLQHMKVFPKADFRESLAPLFGYAKVVNLAPGKILTSASPFRTTDAMNAVGDVCQASK
jgi:hypothetical protein